jgi:hypothetical protein
MIRALRGVVPAILVLVAAGPARAEEPKFAYGDRAELKDVKDVVWKAAVQAGMILTTGNSRTTTISATASASRKSGANKLALEGGAAFARSTVYFAQDLDGNGTIDNDAEILEDAQTTTQAWIVKGRYDRFLTEHNSLYASATAGADEPAGKQFVGGGQVGYSRQLYVDDKHEVVAEVGYDFTYENPVVGPGVSIHSARVFAGYKGKLTPDTGVEAAIEALSNFNSLDTAAGEVESFEDTRINGLTKLTTKVWENVSFGFSFGLKYDHAPSPRPPLGIPYAAGFVPLADELDTKTEVSLIVNFL